MFMEKMNVLEFEEEFLEVEMYGEFSTVNSLNWMMSIVHRCLCSRRNSLFSCVEKGSKGIVVRAVFWGFVLCFYTLDAEEAAPIK